MCNQNVSEVAQVFADVNGDLPVQNVGDGDGTVIMGHSNPHLSVRKAMGCPIARSYFVKAFAELSDADKDGFIQATNLNDFAILTAMVVDDFSGMTMFAYLQANSLNEAQEFVSFIGGKVVAQIGEGDEANEAFAHELDAYFTATWVPLIEADQLADRLQKLQERIESTDADDSKSLGALLSLIAGLR